MFVNVTYTPHFIFHVIYVFVAISLNIANESELGDIIFAGLRMIAIMTIILIELQVYNSYKAKAELFLRVKISEQQSEQLTDLLDAVPDSVLICSQ